MPGSTVAAVRLAGTSGAEQAPMIVSELLTDLDGQVEMARTTLAQSATGETVTRTLQVLTGAGEPGMLQRGQLVLDPAADLEDGEGQKNPQNSQHKEEKDGGN